MIPTCTQAGCDDLAPFMTGTGPKCFAHAEGMTAVRREDIGTALDQVSTTDAKPKRQRKPKDVPADDLNDTAARALASLILAATAEALTTDQARMEASVLSLATDLPAPLEVAAGVLFATTAIAGTAGLTDAEVFTMAAAFEDQAAEESAATDAQAEPAHDTDTERAVTNDES